MLRRARRAPIRADIIIDTDDTVVALLIPSISEVTDTVLSDTAEGGLLDLIEATSYFAGSRAAYAGVVLPPGIGSDVWIARVRRRCLAVHRVLCASGRGVANARGLGAITWNTLIDILTDASQSPLLHAAERALAHGTVRWMSERLSRDEPRGRLA
jgi:hypothetical protein